MKNTTVKTSVTKVCETKMFSVYQRQNEAY